MSSLSMKSSLGRYTAAERHRGTLCPAEFALAYVVGLPAGLSTDSLIA